MMEDAVIALAIIAGYMLLLGVGGLIADYVLPHIPFVARWIESLPDWEEDE